MPVSGASGRNELGSQPPACAFSRMAVSDIAGVSASGSTLRCRIAGLPDCCAASKAGRNPRSSPPSRHSRRRRAHRRQNPDSQACCHDAAGIVALLMHADGAVHAVVDHHDDDRQLDTARRLQIPDRSSGSRRRRRSRSPYARAPGASCRLPRARHSPWSRRSARAACRSRGTGHSGAPRSRNCRRRCRSPHRREACRAATR